MMDSHAEKHDLGVEANSDHGVGIVDPVENQQNIDFYGDSISRSYRMKSEIVAGCMNEIGMGRYQWALFLITGFGWVADNFWSQAIGSIQPAVALEFTDVDRVTVSSIAYYAGMIFGASFWGMSCDFTGRKLAFYATITIGAVFATAVAGFDDFGGFCFMWSIIGTAAGGNVPVDSMIFLEFVPGSHQYLVTALSAWWNLGQLIVSLVAWVFLAKFSCNEEAGVCRKADNMGWRYTMITLGVIALIFSAIRIFIFKMPESPRFLLAKGRDAEAVEAINFVARANRMPEPLSLTMLQEVDAQLGVVVSIEEGQTIKLSKTQILKDNFRDFKPMNYASLFQTRKLGQQTAILWFIWLAIGIAYPLFFNFLPTYLAQRFPSNSFDITYRNYCIVSAVGVIGPISASMLVRTKLGRRWCMGGSAIITGAFLYGYTAAASQSMDLAFNCISMLLANFMYAIMFAITPESFPGPHRGLGTGQAATNLRVGSLVASLIGTYTGFSVVPIYVSAAMWIMVGLTAFGLPFETAGHSAI